MKSEAERFRASGALGRSPQLKALFDYLVESSSADRSPKEDEIAVAVFNRDPAFNRGEDSVVRVYAHRLRRCLSGAYQNAAPGSQVLELRPGEYRLHLADPHPLHDGRGDLPHKPDTEGRMAPRTGWIAVCAFVVGLAVAASGAWLWKEQDQPPGIAVARNNGLWGPLVRNGKPTLVVLGDYYILGDSDDGINVARLVREFEVNSPADLGTYLAANPSMMGRYSDVGLRYLPTSVGMALGGVLPVLGQVPAGGQIRLELASNVTPGMMKDRNVVYVGYFSGMGPTVSSLLGGSRFQVGSSFDEIVDGRTGRHYTSQGGYNLRQGQAYADYGLVRSLRSSTGTVVVIIAGARDAALQRVSEIATGGALPPIANGQPFEALYEVTGLNNTDVTAGLVAASPVDSAAVWRPEGDVR